MDGRKRVAVPCETVTEIGGTEYIVRTVFATDTEETIYDKIERLILNNIGTVFEENAA